MAVPKPQWHVKLSLSFQPECEWAPECSVKAEGVARIPQATVVKASQSRAQGGCSANRGDGGVGRTEQESPALAVNPRPGQAAHPINGMELLQTLPNTTSCAGTGVRGKPTSIWPPGACPVVGGRHLNKHHHAAH